MRVYQAPTVASTGIANAKLEPDALPPYVKEAFLTGMKNFGVFDNKPTSLPIRKVRLPRGFKLYKFTEYQMKNHQGRITEWWSPIDAYEADPGLGQRLALAKCFGVSSSDLSGVYAAVREDWNALTHILKATLLRDVYAFFGQCAMQPRQSTENNALKASRPLRAHGRTGNLPGYAWQFYIPNLTDSDIVQNERIPAP